MNANTEASFRKWDLQKNIPHLAYLQWNRLFLSIEDGRVSNTRQNINRLWVLLRVATWSDRIKGDFFFYNYGLNEIRELEE